MNEALNSLDFESLSAWLVTLGGTREEARKLFAAIFAHRAGELSELRSVRAVRRTVLDEVQQRGALPRLEVLERRRASDGFVKYLFRSPLGGEVEAVRIPLFEEKYVVCISSQVGCALACDFCMTGKMGFARNLKTWEMVEQVQVVREEADRPVRGVVFMGMGEPLLNYDRVLEAARIFSDPAGLAISGKAITLSTAGVVPAIRRYVEEGHPYRLAFSISSTLPEKRLKLMPIEATWPLPELVGAIADYARVRRERAMIAYVAIAGLNTGREDAESLARTFAGIPIKLDLIDVTDPTGRYRAPDAVELKRFRDELQILKSPIARRYSGGKEIHAACGTLAATRQGGELLAGLAALPAGGGRN